MGCGSEPAPQMLAGSSSCPTISGSAWVPGFRQHLPAPEANVEEELVVKSGPVSRLDETPQEIEVEIALPQDLGEWGSLSLVAETSAEAFPALVSLKAGEQELVGLTRSGSGSSSCSEKYLPSEGLFCCLPDGSSCVPNPAFQISYPSAFANREQWAQHQFSDFGSVSVNTFPTCKWEQGDPKCIFSDRALFPLGRLTPGKTYRARYALLSSQVLPAQSRPTPSVSDLSLTVLRKSAPPGAAHGFDLNMILVGSENVAASRTAKGQRNLDALVSHVVERYGQPGARIQVGRVNVIEWGCETGGDAYANVDIDDIGTLLESGSDRIAPELEGRALNLFLVSNIGGSERGFTFLGVSGGIGGPAINGTATSGVVASSFGMIETFNPRCLSDAPCELSLQDKDFIELGETISHEMGHYFGLNHPSESSGRRHDALPDTPRCLKTEFSIAGPIITIRSCRKLDSENIFPPTGRSCLEACPYYDGRDIFCPNAAECQFNHLMWWTSKNISSKGTGDGSLLSPDSVALIRFHPVLR